MGSLTKTCKLQPNNQSYMQPLAEFKSCWVARAIPLFVELLWSLFCCFALLFFGVRSQ